MRDGTVEHDEGQHGRKRRAQRCSPLLEQVDDAFVPAIYAIAMAADGAFAALIVAALRSGS